MAISEKYLRMKKCPKCRSKNTHVTKILGVGIMQACIRRECNDCKILFDTCELDSHVIEVTSKDEPTRTISKQFERRLNAYIKEIRNN